MTARFSRVILLYLLLSFSGTVAAGDEGAFRPIKDPDTPGGYMVPREAREAVRDLRAALSASALEDLQLTPEDELTVKFHRSLGMSIRNAWLLEGSPLIAYFREHGISQPDDGSDVIIHALWRELNGKPVDLPSMIEESAQDEMTTLPPPTTHCPDHPETEMQLLIKEWKRGSGNRLVARQYALCPLNLRFWVYQYWEGWAAATDEDAAFLKEATSVTVPE